jgi:hypothetical protein
VKLERNRGGARLLVGLLSEWGCSKLDKGGVNMVKIERGEGVHLHP